MLMVFGDRPPFAYDWGYFGNLGLAHDTAIARKKPIGPFS